MASASGDMNINVRANTAQAEARLKKLEAQLESAQARSTAAQANATAATARAATATANSDAKRAESAAKLAAVTAKSEEAIARSALASAVAAAEAAAKTEIANQRQQQSSIRTAGVAERTAAQIAAAQSTSAAATERAALGIAAATARAEQAQTRAATTAATSASATAAAAARAETADIRRAAAAATSASTVEAAKARETAAAARAAAAVTAGASNVSAAEARAAAATARAVFTQVDAANRVAASNARLAATVARSKAAITAAEARTAAAAEAAAARQVAANNRVAASSMAANASMARGAAGSVNAIRGVGTSSQWAGRQLSQNFTAPLALAAGLGIKWELDNREAMANLKKTYGEFGADPGIKTNELGALGKAFEALSNEFGINQSEVIEVAAGWSAAGASGRNLADLTKLTMETMIVGNMDSAKSLESLIAIQGQYNLSTQGLVETVQQLNATENISGIQFDGLVDGYARAAGAARGAGITTQELAAMLAAISPAAGSAVNAGNGLKTMFANLIEPTAQFKDILGEMKIDLQSPAWKDAGGAARFKILAKGFEGLDDAQKGVFAATFAGIYQLNRAETAFRDVANEAGIYEKTLALISNQSAITKIYTDELTAVLESDPRKLKIAGQVIKNNLTKAFAGLIPHIISITQQIGRMMQGFNKMRPEVKKLVGTILLLVAILGPILLLFGTFLIMIGVVGKAILGLGGAMMKFARILFFPFAAIFRLTFGFLANASAALFNARSLKAVGGAMIFVMRLMRAMALWQLRVAMMYLLERGFMQIAWAFKLAYYTAALALASTSAARELAVQRIKNLLMIMEGQRFHALFLTMQRVYNAVKIQLILWANSIELALLDFKEKLKAAKKAVYDALAIARERIKHALLLALGAVFVAADLLMHAFGETTKLARTWVFGKLRVAATAISSAAEAAVKQFWRIVDLVRDLAAKAAELFREVSFQSIKFALIRGWKALTNAMQVAMDTAYVIWTYGLRPLLVGAWAAIQAGILLVQKIGFIKHMAMSVVFWIAYLGGWRAMGMKLLGFVGRLFTQLPAMVMKGMRLVAIALSGPWGWAIAAVVLALVMFKDQIKTFIQSIIKYFKNLPPEVSKQFDPLIGFFHKMGAGITGAFNKLPAGIRGALQAVINLVKNAAMKVYELFQYMNPFKRHSPSLVENVTNGLGVVGAQFGLVTGVIRGHMQNAYGAMKKFGEVTRNFLGGQESAKQAQQRNEIAKIAPGILGSYDELASAVNVLKGDLEQAGEAVSQQEVVVAKLDGQVKAADANLKSMNATLDVLKERSDAASTALDAAKQSVSDYASMQITGMRAADDATFANSMAQKQLQLQMAKLKNTTGIDNQTDAFARLQGQIETMTGESMDLRSKGAGSDITGVYDGMIAGLKGQQDLLNAGGTASGPAAEISALQKALDDLQAQAEIMDLEKALKFDPLQRQIEQTSTGLHEMPFEEIMSGMQKSQLDVARYTAELDQASAAVRDQEAAVKAAQTARDALGAVYDAENEKLSALKDVYQGINDTISEGEQALQNMTSAATEAIQQANEAASAAKEAAGGGGGSDAVSPSLQAFRDAEGGNFADVAGNTTLGRIGGDADQSAEIDAFTTDLEGVGDMFGGLDMFAPIKEYWNKFTAWWGATVTPAWNVFAQIFTGSWAMMSNPFEGLENDGTGFVGWLYRTGQDLRDLWDSVFEFLRGGASMFGEDLQNTIGQITAGFGDIWNKIAPAFQNLWGAMKPLWDALWPVLQALGVVIAGVFGQIVMVVEVVWEMVNGALGPAFDLIGDLFNRVIEIITGVIRVITGAINIVVGVVQAIVGLIKGIFTGDWSMLEDGFRKIWQGIFQIFQGLGEIISGIWNSIMSIFSNGAEAVWNIAYGFVKGIIDFFIHLWDVLVGNSIVPDTINAIVEWFRNLPGWVLGIIHDFIMAIITFFYELPGNIWDALKSLGTTIGNVFNGAMNYVRDLLPSWAQGVFDFFRNLPGQIVSFVRVFIENFPAIFSGAMDKLRDMLPGWAQGPFDFFRNLPGTILTILKNMPSVLLEKGEQLIDGLLEGVKNKASKIGEFFLDLLPSWIRVPFEKALDINSPSKVFDTYGGNIGDGLIQGLDGKQQPVKDAIAGLAAIIETQPVDATAMNEAIAGMADNTKTLEERTSALTSAMGTQREAEFARLELAASIGESIDGVTSALAKQSEGMFTATGQINLGTEAGRGIQSAMIDVAGSFDQAGASAYASAIQQNASQAEAAKAAITSQGVIVDSLVESMRQAGLTDDQIDQMIKTYNLVPPRTYTQAIFDDMQARAAVQAWVNDFEAHPIRLAVAIQAGVTAQPELNRDPGSFVAPLPGVPRRAAGGLLNGPGTPTSDDILGLDKMGMPTALVSTQEYVVNAQATREWLPLLEAINSGSIKRLADGGAVAGAVSGAADAAGAAASTGAVATATMTLQTDVVSNVVEQVTAVTTEAQDVWDGFTVQQDISLNTLQAMYENTYIDIGLGITTSNAGTIATLSQQTLDYTVWNDNIHGAMRDAVVARNQEMHDRIIGLIVDLVNVLMTWFTTMRDQLNARMTETRDTQTTLFQSLASNFSNIFNNGIRPVFDSFLPMLQTVEGWFSSTVGNIGSIWNGVREATAVPARFVINEVYNAGIKEAWNKTNSFLGLEPLADFTAAFAAGGPVHGRGTGTSDEINARLSNNEHVITAKEVRNAGGHDAVKQQRAIWRSGKKMQSEDLYAKGGPVLLPGFAEGGGYTWQSIDAAVRKISPDVINTSNVRFTDSGYHSKGQAVDFSYPGDPVPKLNALSRAVAAAYGPQLSELINGGGANIYNGKDVGDGYGLYGAGTMAQHNNHVHVASPTPLGEPGANFAGFDFAGVAIVKTFKEQVEDVWKEVMDPVKEKATAFAGGIKGGISKWATGAIDPAAERVHKFLTDTATKKDTERPVMGTSGVRESWRPMAMAALVRNGFIPPESYIEAMLDQIMSESGGNPSIIQGVQDVNSGGNEAQGLLQIIPGTFAAYRDPSLPDDRTDPWANMNASLRYMRGRYNGDINGVWGAGHGYDEGGYMMPGVGIYDNKTGKPEPVFNPTQWQILKQAVHQGITGQGISGQLEALIKSDLQPTLDNVGIKVGQTQAAIDFANRDQLAAINKQTDAIEIMPEVFITAENATVQELNSLGNKLADGWQGVVEEWGPKVDAAVKEYGPKVEAAIDKLTPVLEKQAAVLGPKIETEFNRLGPILSEAWNVAQVDPQRAYDMVSAALADSGAKLAPYVTDSIKSLEATFNSAVAAIPAAGSATAGADLPSRAGTAAGTVPTTQNITNNITNNNENTFHFHGDFVLPNIKSGADADDFIDNIRTRAGV